MAAGFVATIVSGKTTESDQIPTFNYEYDAAYAAVGGGILVNKWTNMEIFIDKVTITTYSLSSFTEDYIIYVLKYNG